MDGTGILIVTCFRQPWLMDQVKAGDAVAVSGKVTFDYGYKRMTNPFIEVIGEGEEVTGSVVPVHPATEKLTAAWVRRIVANGLEAAEGLFDPLPLGLRLRYRLMSRNAALRAIHFPRTMPEADEARRRLVYEELLYLELFLMQEGAARSAGCVPHAHVVDGPRLAAFASSLPFELTGEQQRARDEILSALAAPTVANHMLLGDVGTGKTVVAGHALAAAADSEGQAMLLAPTEVLARQHMAGPGRAFGRRRGARRPAHGLYGCRRAEPLSWKASPPGRWTCSSALTRFSPTTSCRTTSPWRSSTSSSASASINGRSFWKRARRPTRCT